MTMTDPIADMLTRLRNANSAYHDTVAMPYSKIKAHIAEILQQEGYISADGQDVTVKGPKGELKHTVARPIEVVQEDGTVKVGRPSDEGPIRALHGLTRTLINNMVVGVTEGYSKTLEIVGVGYRVQA